MALDVRVDQPVREAVHQEDRRSILEDLLLCLLVEGHAPGRVRFEACLVEGRVRDRSAVNAGILLGTRIEQPVCEVLRIGIIRTPATREELTMVATTG